jgi:hypothetical protein
MRKHLEEKMITKEWMKKEVVHLTDLELEAIRRLKRAEEAKFKVLEEEANARNEYESICGCRMEWERQIKALEASEPPEICIKA